MAEVRDVQDWDTTQTDIENGFKQRVFILKENVKFYLKLTKSDNSIVNKEWTVPVGKEVKVQLMVQLRKVDYMGLNDTDILFIHQDTENDDIIEKRYYIGQNSQVDLKITKTDLTTINRTFIIPSGKAAKVVIYATIRDLGNWDITPPIN